MTTRPSPAIRGLATRLIAPLVALTLAACGGGGGGSTDAAAAPPTSPTPATITTQPNDASVPAGSAISFTVAASGTGPLVYQWSSSADGVTFTAIVGATAATFGIGATTLAMNGTHYRVVVGNGAGSSNSSSVLLTVTAAVAAPVITVQPADQTVTAPLAATFNVTATGTTPSYQWQLSTDSGVSFVAVPGAPDAPTLSVVGTTTAQSGRRYRVVVSNAVGSVSSSGALLTVNPTPVAPVITVQPSGATIVAGGAASFTVAATGTPAPAIQWRLNGGNLANGVQASGACSGASVAGAAAATLSFSAVPGSCSGAVLSAVASNGAAPDATSANAVLTVITPMPPVITLQPASQTTLTDGMATFTVTATGPGLTYQWRRNANNIVGATAATYTTPAMIYADDGSSYQVVVSNADGIVYSNSATLRLVASADQAAFESLILSGGGSYEIRWNLNYSGAETSGVNYAFSDFAVQTLSALTNGPQVVTQSPPVNIATTLAPVTGTVLRVLNGGVILVVPIQSTSISQYSGSQVRVDYLASDGISIAWSQLRSNYATVPLTGNVKTNTPSGFAQWHNSFFSNPAVLKGTTSWAAGASYITYTATAFGDRYTVFDCNVATTGANPDPCITGGTLAAALSTGMYSASDGTTYFQADGVTTTIRGVPVWVATSPRPANAALSSTVQYRIYFQLNGNVYTGSLIRDGTVLGGSYYVPTPGALIFLPYQLRMNKAARDSLAADMAI